MKDRPHTRAVTLLMADDYDKALADWKAKHGMSGCGAASNPNDQFPTCVAVGFCAKPTAEAAPHHHFYWDGERDAKRMDKIHGKRGKGHDDPLAAYGAVVCKTCGRRALVLHDAEDFPQI